MHTITDKITVVDPRTARRREKSTRHRDTETQRARQTERRPAPHTETHSAAPARYTRPRKATHVNGESRPMPTPSYSLRTCTNTGPPNSAPPNTSSPTHSRVRGVGGRPKPWTQNPLNRVGSVGVRGSPQGLRTHTPPCATAGGGGKGGNTAGHPTARTHMSTHTNRHTLPIWRLRRAAISTAVLAHQTPWLKSPVARASACAMSWHLSLFMFSSGV